MKFEISDEAVLMVSGVGCAAFATYALAAPKHYHETFMTKDQIGNDVSWRWFGQALVSKGTTDLCISVSEPGRKALKNSLKLSGFQWMAAAAHMAYRGSEGTQKKELSYACALGQAALGALCLWRGFDDN